MGRNDTKQTKKVSKHKKEKILNNDAMKLMRSQLANVGCKLLLVEADGNCLFRALSDQLYGDQHRHDDVRKHHRNDFEPFMEDDEKFEKYCERIREDGTWGGNQELYAAARLFQVYIIVHQDQLEAPIMVIECDRLRPTRIIHVAYHSEDHYDSVRSLKDCMDPDTLPISFDLECEGYRVKDLAKRWHTHMSTSESSNSEQVELSVVPEASMNLTDGRVDELANRLSKQLQIAAGTVSGTSGKILSKKELRQLRKAQKIEKSQRVNLSKST
ncbi:OTU (ovarian tumor)-like cysteine protease [Plasmopara halstedii]|uniref:OTU (Ovarian tumor)-like cysteine protease n=1 Tax=Plasmopara halstedii TaxID=4781 RepID=A0A0P1ABP0_PLAHL|nr:OTU (ovarian tumor)-like cysteine protease [Plasmopara halstedii]CEG37822.1 OTU (ovarian tumor)-like cysteine protease [Plasmopara halstedii]|eukprot:XP_024574191.1 OTU (ovarian tumor)-like cysteine protease [Plasmopara halstedii]